jgi:hypothetical protein
MISYPLRRWFWLIAVWIPFPCLFLPFTMMKEDYDPWYVNYTSPLVLLAMMFYQPANLLTTGVRIIFGYAPSMPAMHVAAFIQSLILSYFVLKAARTKAAPSDSSQP